MRIMRLRATASLAALAVGAGLTIGTVMVAPPAHAATKPTITSISPTVGPVGTTVVIKGTNFVAPVTIKFGDALASGSFTPTKLTVVAPGGESGTVTVSVTTQYGTAKAPQKYTYGKPVKATSARLTSSRTTIYPKDNSAKRKVRLTGHSDTSSGKVTAGTGSITIETKSGTKVRQWAVNTSADRSVTWNGLDHGKLKPGKYDAKYSFAGTTGPAVHDSVHLTVSKKKGK